MGNNKLVCIDSQVFVWGIKKVASSGQEEMIPKTIRFLEHLDEQKEEILLPSPVLTEVLTPVPPSQHPKILAIINKRFRVASFDTVAAMKCAEMIYHKKHNDTGFMEAKKSGKYNRRKMKYDFLISALAIVNNAKCIYTDDSDIHKFCNEFIDIRNIPSIPKQSEIEFED